MSAKVTTSYTESDKNTTSFTDTAKNTTSFNPVAKAVSNFDVVSKNATSYIGNDYDANGVRLNSDTVTLDSLLVYLHGGTTLTPLSQIGTKNLTPYEAL